jgi:hypothetical protein
MLAGKFDKTTLASGLQGMFRSKTLGRDVLRELGLWELGYE